MTRRVQESELAPDKRRINDLEQALSQSKKDVKFMEDKLMLAVQDFEEANSIIEKLNMSRTPQAELYRKCLIINN